MQAVVSQALSVAETLQDAVHETLGVKNTPAELRSEDNTKPESSFNHPWTKRSGHVGATRYLLK